MKREKPRKLRVLGIALLVVVSSLTVFIPGTPADAAASTQTLNMIGGNTSGQLPVGAPDPFTDVSIDNGVTWRPAILGGDHPWAEPAGTNSWLNCPSASSDPLGSCSNAFPVTSFFRYRFWIASDFSNGSLSGEFNVDNYAKFFINGVAPANCFLGCTQNANNGFAGGFSTSTIEANNGGQPADINSLLQPGWNTFYVVLIDTGGLSGIAYNLQLSISSASPITVAAPGTLVLFDAQGGSASASNASVGFGQPLSSITLPTATRPGYSFDGWYTSAVGGILVDSAYAASTTPSSDLTLYARWIANPATPAISEDGATALVATGSADWSSVLPALSMMLLGAGTLIVSQLSTRRERAESQLAARSQPGTSA